MSEDVGKDMLEYFQKMWNPASFPLPGMFAPTMSAQEVDKKLSDLQAVEAWLKMSLGMLQMTMKALEMQKAALATLEEAARPAARPGKGG